MSSTDLTLIDEFTTEENSEVQIFRAADGQVLLDLWRDCETGSPRCLTLEEAERLGRSLLKAAQG
jgi:hypothetical protein